jgi:sulfoacetaldehyde dehydrogenase
MEDEMKIIGELVSKAKAAQRHVENYTQEQIDEVCYAVGWQLYKDDNIAACAKAAVEETGMGVCEDKIKKHKVKVFGVCRDIRNAKTVGIIERDEAKGITKYAKPVGVVGALTPVTNPTASLGSNGVSVLKGRNAVIFAPHPKAKRASYLAADFMRQGLKKIGAPADLVQCIKEPTIQLSQELMRQVDLVFATGGAAMVKAAYSSGTPAFGVGPGNPVIIVAEDADLADAADKITLSKTFDNATSCSSENAVLIHESVYDSMLDEFVRRGGYFCSEEEKKKLEKWMWVENAKTGKVGLNPKIIAISAKRIAEGSGLSVPDNTRMLMVLGDVPGEGHFSGEKISPVMTIWKYRDIDEAMDMVKKIHSYAGLGHSCGLYTFNQDYIHKAASELKVSRVLVRQAHAPSAGGNYYNGMPSTVSLGCGTWGGNITTENIHWKHFINLTWLSEPIDGVNPSEEEIFGKLWEKYGK